MPASKNAHVDLGSHVRIFVTIAKGQTMTDVLLRRPYVKGRILIDANRTIDSSFPKIGVILHGEELEILRNLLEYANRIESFVDEYDDNTYVVPDDDTWEKLQTITASLEGKLMGNDNTIWAYHNTLTLSDDYTTVSTSPYNQEFDTVPEGEIWVVQGVSIMSDVAPGILHVYHKFTGGVVAITDTLSWTVGQFTAARGLHAHLEEGDFIRLAWYGLSSGQRLLSSIWGYKMKIDA